MSDQIVGILALVLILGSVIGMMALAVKVKKVQDNRIRSLEPKFTLIETKDGEEIVTDSPEWRDIEAALLELKRGSRVCLVGEDAELAAEGVPSNFRIQLSCPGHVPVLLGRLTGGNRRGHAELQGDCAVVTPLERWSTSDGGHVFRHFFNEGASLDQFTKRDPSRPLSPEEIRGILRNGVT